MSYPHNPVKQRSSRHPRSSLNKQRGVVIVVALFIVALVATMAYVMMARLERDTHRTSLILRDTQAEFYAQGSIAWAIDLLRNDWERQNPQQMIDALPIKSPIKEMDGYKITSTIYDMQSRFNLNNLSDKQAQIDFKRLMQVVDPKLSDQKAQEILRAIADWIEPLAQQKENTNLSPMYRIAHRPMQSASELKLVKGMTPTLYNALQPYVTALPGMLAVNVQTAPAPVLMTLSPTLTLEGARAIEQLRAQTPIISANVFLNLDSVKNQRITPQKITVVSDYFLVATEVTIEKQHIVIYTLLERTTKGRKAEMTILWQSKGIE